MVRHLKRKTRKSRRALRRRRITRRAKRLSQKGGSDIPEDDNARISMRNGNDIDSVETVVSKPLFDSISTADPEAAV